MPSTASIPDEVRRHAAERARWRCEYCMLPQADGGFRHHIDHIVSRKHGGGSQEDNLALACAVCNRNKGTDVAALSADRDQPVRLFHPRRQAWADHFRFDGPFVRALTETGEVTIRVLRMNDPWRIQERAALQSSR